MNITKTKTTKTQNKTKPQKQGKKIQKIKTVVTKTKVQKPKHRISRYLTRYHKESDPSMMSSVHKLIQTQFYPDQGIFRGISNGLEMTGITNFKGSFEMTCGPTNNITTFAFTPFLFNSPPGSPGINFFNWIAATTFTNPSQAPLAGVTGGPFVANNPSVLGRVVSASLNIVPASAVLQRGGEGKLAYSSALQSLNWTRSDIDNLAISRSWDGVDAMTLHWTPGDPEYSFAQGVTAGQGTSALVGYIVAPTTGQMIWRVEWQVGIEYIPNASFRPLIDRKAPKIRPDARYFLNEAVQEHWTPLMISTMSNYIQRLSISSSLGGHTPIQFFDHAGTGGSGFNTLNAPEQAAVYEEFEDEGYVNVVAGKVKKAFCGVASAISGEDICGDPIGAMGNMAGQYARARVRNQHALQY